MKRLHFTITFLLFTAFLGQAFSSTSSSKADQKGLEIAKKMELANKGFIGEISKMKMILIDAYGAKIEREMKGMSKEVKDDGDQSIINFIKPADIKGTKMLTHSHKKNDDDQWLYLPSMRRIKRISSNSKFSSFMGSEFTFEDLGGQELEKYNFKYLKDSKNKNHWVVQRIAKNIKKTGYSKQIMWVQKKYFAPSKIEYYDRKGKLIKVAEFQNYKAYNVNAKTLWKPDSIHMKNIQTKKQSLFTWVDRKLGKKFKKRDFDKRSLKK